MDPIANINEQRALSRLIIATYENVDSAGQLNADQCAILADDAMRLAELVQALDAWQTAGGFSPYHGVPKYPQMAGE